jgi:hypothetical protein
MSRPTTEEMRERRRLVEDALRQKTLETFREALKNVHINDFATVRCGIQIRYGGKLRSTLLPAIDDERRRRSE